MTHRRKPKPRDHRTAEERAFKPRPGTPDLATLNAAIARIVADDPWPRTYACETLVAECQRGTFRFAPVLIALLDDPNEFIAQDASNGLHALAPPCWEEAVATFRTLSYELLCRCGHRLLHDDLSGPITDVLCEQLENASRYCLECQFRLTAAAYVADAPILLTRTRYLEQSLATYYDRILKFQGIKT